VIALVPALAGALVVAGLLGLVAGLRRTALPAPVRVRSTHLSRLRHLSRRARILLLAGLAAGILAWLVTGWALALVAVPVAAVGLPTLVSAPPAAARIERLDRDVPAHRRGQRGSVTIEYVLWAVAVIAIVAIVVAAVKAYVTSQAGNIR
jgi:hypothetical protein